ncbi:MarR family winged helix-turn-helix transcriptional regulator [Sulfobacillus harzensis]|uniref:MarR family transcriptional regulator n=1 Tax=Sulfobacillus harzensis TaxID=2729629 RepID=A0A7Y0Q0S0_9FIRM|nr:MarR family transcriptional regulator [Sulfobacillus harzensis]NMP21333.1 MarR family transcriptional regulator [Sulfobacillus harzensis]
MTEAGEVFERVFLLIREFELAFREQGDVDLSTTQFQALAILADVEPVTAMAMAGLLRIAGPTATRTVDSLERRGLVLKERDPQDRRVVWIRLTKDGRQVLEQQRERQRVWMQRLLQALSPEEQETLNQILHKLGVQAALLS